MSNRPSFPSINIGDAPPALVCGPLTRTQFVRYAGASHDFNPNHHDEVYAKASGNKAVFGMGMLAGGYCARLLTDWFGDGALRALRIRFASRFWPGDVLTCSAAVTGKREVAGEGLVDCEFSAVNQNGDLIIRGDATAALPR
jgi:peroxisomal enoyl-CoA hydratase 2